MCCVRAGKELCRIWTGAAAVRRQVALERAALPEAEQQRVALALRRQLQQLVRPHALDLPAETVGLRKALPLPLAAVGVGAIEVHPRHADAAL